MTYVLQLQAADSRERGDIPGSTTSIILSGSTISSFWC